MTAELSTITSRQIGFAVILFAIAVHRILVAVVCQPKFGRRSR